jgi:hypothetical protein
VTPAERLEIDRWFKATQDSMPSGAMALLIYARDGHVIIGRGSTLVEMRDFNLKNLPQVRRNIADALASLEAKAREG